MFSLITPSLSCVQHFISAIKKKLVAAAKLRESGDLNRWIQSIVNHLYWCAGSSVEDQDLILPKWISLVSHVANIHTHTDPLFPDCEHGELEKKWLLKARMDLTSYEPS